MSASKSVATRVSDGELPPVPRKLGRYRVLFELGRGGMATVYLAVTQSASGVSKLVALKALLPEYASEADASAMFLDEARLAVQLNHGNVVQTYEAGKEGDREVIVMEYLEGHSLASLLKRAGKRGQPLPLGLHLRLLMQVLEGLHFTHELQGYDGTPLYPVHRDVSPQNVFITYDGRVKLLDFGIAKAASSTTRTTTGLIKGKIAYMSPEQMGSQSVDRRADVYAVGCMLWAAAARRRLWSDLTDVTIMHSVITDAIPAPRTQNPDCDPELERIVMKALARLDLRYSSALELHEELERFCEAKGIPDRPRELGRVISELFADDRAELRARIERELSLVESKLTFAAPEPRAQIEIAIGADRPQRSSTRTLSATVNAISPKQSGRRRRWSWLAIGVPALALAGYLVLPRQPAPQAVVAPTPARAAAVTRAAATQPAIVTFELRSRPPTALLFLDDKPLEGNPALLALPKDGGEHRVRAELAGYRTASAVLMSTGDQALDLKLEEISRGESQKKPTPPIRIPQKAVAPPAASRSAPKSADCTQPFYVGPDGIKKIKPACL